MTESGKRKPWLWLRVFAGLVAVCLLGLAVYVFIIHRRWDRYERCGAVGGYLDDNKGMCRHVRCSGLKGEQPDPGGKQGECFVFMTDL